MAISVDSTTLVISGKQIAHETNPPDTVPLTTPSDAERFQRQLLQNDKRLCDGLNAFAGVTAPDAVSVAAAGTVTTDASTSSEIQDITAAGSFTLANPTNPTNGQKKNWRIFNNTGSPITVTLGNKFNFGDNVTSFSTVAAGEVAYLAARYRTLGAVTKWDVLATDAF